MNENSYICRFIKEHPDNFEKLLEDELKIKTKRDGNLAIFNYSFDCDFSNPIVCEARGIIIDTETLSVVCHPFRKFGNYNEYYTDKIDWSTALVLEKVDGSIIKLWFNRGRDRWQFSTNSMIDADNAGIEAFPGLSYGSIIRSADNYKDIPFSELDRDTTYIFELVSPGTKVIIDYPDTSLYHIGTRSNITGLESHTDIGIKKPKSFKLTSLDECIRAAIELNHSGGDEISAEGFVVVDENFNRVKIKSPDYIIMHKLKANNSVRKLDCLNAIIKNPAEIDKICGLNPGALPHFKFYEFKLAELKYSADRLAELARALYREYSGDRAAVAKTVLKHRLSFVAFSALECNKSGGEILKDSPIEKLARLIPDYTPNDDLSDLFS